MKLTLVLIWMEILRNPKPSHSRSKDEMRNLTYLKNVTNLDSIQIRNIFYGDKK